MDQHTLAEIGFYPLDKGEILPDVVAMSQRDHLLFIIECVYSSGPVSASKKLRYETLVTGISLPVVFVTTFLTQTKFRSLVPDIAWESEVWIAEHPDHLVHFNGERFLQVSH